MVKGLLPGLFGLPAIYRDVDFGEIDVFAKKLVSMKSEVNGAKEKE